MKKILLFSLSLIGYLTNFAQPTINGIDINPVAGESFTDNNTAYTSPGTAGANQTWDLSSLTSNGTTTTTVSSTTVNAANTHFSSTNGDSYMNINSSAQEIIEINASNIIFTYTDGEKIIQFPLSYNTTYTDSFRATFTSGTYPAVRSGNCIGTVDGYGTLILPNQTITDVIRINYQQDYYDTIDLGSPFIIHYISNVYTWYKAGSHFPIASLSNLESGGQTTEYGAYTNETNLSVSKIDEINEVHLLGNPFQSILSFTVDANASKEIEYSIVDLSGQVVYQSNTTTILPGKNKLSINTENLSKGVYALKISNGFNFISKLIIKE